MSTQLGTGTASPPRESHGPLVECPICRTATVNRRFCPRDGTITAGPFAVGDRYVVERMREGGFNLGGEQSGHLIFLDHTTTGDGVVAALNLVSVMVREQRALSEIAAVFQASPQELVNIKVGRKVPLEELPGVQAVIDEVTGLLGGDGRVLVRYSGTEMKARVMVEGPDAAMVGALARRIADALAAALA